MFFFLFLFFLYFIVFIVGCTRDNASLNNFCIKKDTHKKNENEKEREVRKEANYIITRYLYTPSQKIKTVTRLAEAW